MRFIKENNILKYIAIYGIVIVYINGIRSLMKSLGFDPTTDIVANAVFSTLALGGIGAVVIKLALKDYSWHELGLSQNCRKRDFIIGIILAIVIVSSYIFLGRFIEFEYQGLGFRMFSKAMFVRTLLSGIVLAFVSGLIEEIVFRGYLFNGLTEKNSTQKSVIITSLLFMVVHLPSSSYTEILNFLVPFSMGILLALLRLNYKSIWASIGMHMMYNLLVISVIGIGSSSYEKAPLFVFNYVPSKITILNNEIGDFSTLILVLIVSLLIMLYYLRHKKIENKKETYLL